MGPFEICLIVFCSIACAIILGVYIYKRIKHIPTGDCGCCHNAAKKYRKKYLKQYHKACQKSTNSCCCCQDHDKKSN